MLIVLVFAVIVLKALFRVAQCQDRFARLAGIGLVTQLGLQALINMAVNLNLVPTKGMTLPLISYGGSSMVAARDRPRHALGADAQRRAPRSDAMSDAYLIAAGGTGGHVFPALALARELVRRGAAVTMLTDSRGARYLPADITQRRIEAASPSGGMASKLKAVWALARGFARSLALIGEARPPAVACFGGYASFPAAMAALVRRVPVMIHEQNAVVGRANRVIARFARIVALSFEDTERLPGSSGRRIVTGNPVREGFGPSRRPAKGERTVLLVIGGSQGAKVLSDVVPAAVTTLPPSLLARVEVWQQCRPEDLERVREAYAGTAVATDLRTFFDDMPERMAGADLVISRSGASSVSELLALAKPAILVPYLHATDNHQQANAERLVAAGAAMLARQDEITPQSLATTLEALLASPERLDSMRAAAATLARPDAASALADAMQSLAEEHPR